MGTEIVVIWSGLLTFFLSVISWILKSYAEEVKRLNILLNQTREQMAREYVTKNEVHTDINRVITRLEALDAKLDRMMESYNKK